MNERRPNFSVQEPSFYQLGLLDLSETNSSLPGEYRERLIHLLSGDLDYHGYDTSYASHDFHAFPAKFPPPLPETFIRGLTSPGDTVLDPMMGSGTAIVEAFLAGRRCIGADIDPLALLIAKVKTTPLDPGILREQLLRIIDGANRNVADNPDEVVAIINARWDRKTREFVAYWFAPETICELSALLLEIEKIETAAIRSFFMLVFSACIITKTGGVSLAFDLAHTRPHRAKVVYTATGNKILGSEYDGDESERIKFLTKNLRSAIVEFRKRAIQNIQSISELGGSPYDITLQLADAQALPVETSSVDLIITSPPYAVNAIDYMRANKFSLVWFGYTLEQLSETRKHCIGGESTAAFDFENLPQYTSTIVAAISAVDPKRGKALWRYYSEMTRILREMHRVLKPDRAAIVVVASSEIRQIDTATHICLAEIGEAIGFQVPKIGVRRLDRNRRMMPAGHRVDSESQIQKRMHEEFVVGFYKAT
ncbi:MAG TPA: site-specific DNA-methyltransferase [Chloroflexi bacterium]|nr:site-specific DNA-methyltransferase [Chloroflexota bacterium]